eukprot:scpid59249/ scgid19893/ 
MPDQNLYNDVRLKKLAATDRQAPPLRREDEKGLRRLKEDLSSMYRRESKHARATSDSATQKKLSKSQFESLKALKNNPGVVVKPSDKGKGFVVISAENYRTKVYNMLNRPADYEPSRVKIDALDSECRETLKGCIKDKLPEKLEKAMYQYYSRMPQFYGFPEDHKPGMPLRPVVSTCDSPTSNMSLLVERTLNQLLRFLPAHLRDTKQCIDHLPTHHNIPEHCIVASMDVVAL